MIDNNTNQTPSTPTTQAGAIEIMLRPLRNFYSFSGRSQRLEMIGPFFFGIIISIIYLIDLIPSREHPHFTLSAILGVIVAIYLFLMGISLIVRRLHDIDKSGWWYWIFLIPIIGGLILFYWTYLKDGTKGPNRFGEDPKGRPAPQK